MGSKKSIIHSIRRKQLHLLGRGRGERPEWLADLWKLLLTIPFLLVFSTVFVVNRELANGVVSGKYFWFYAAMGLVSITTFVNFSLFTFRFSLLDFLVLLFTGSIYISSLIINDASQNTTKLIILALLVVLYFCLRMITSNWLTSNVVSHRGNLESDKPQLTTSNHSPDSPLGAGGILVVIIIISGLVEAIWGLRQLYGFEQSQHSLFKLTGSFFNPGPYSGYLAVVFPLALYYALKENHSYIIFKHGVARSWFTEIHGVLNYLRYNAIKVFSIITCVAILLVLPAAMSRASWLAVMSGSIVVLSGRYSHFFIQVKTFCRLHKKKVLAAAVIGVVLLLAAFTGMYLLKKDSADGRTLMWKIALQTAAKHPLGVGLGNFSGAYGDVQATYFACGNGSVTEEYVAGSPEYGFNEYLQIAVESGVVSLLLFLLIIGFCIKNLLKSKKYGIFGSLISLLVFALFSYPFSMLPFLIVFVFLVAAGNNNQYKWNADNADNADSHGFLKNIICVNLCYLRYPRSIIFPVSLLCFVATCFCLYKEYPVYLAYKKWNQEKLYYNAGLYKDVAKDYKELYPLLSDQIQFLFEYAQSLSKSEQYAESNRVLQRAIQISCDPMLYNIMGKNYQALQEYEQAETCFIKASNITPSRLYPFYLLTKLYHEMGLQEKVNEMAETVQTKEPKVHSRAVEEMRKEVRKLRTKN